MVEIEANVKPWTCKPMLAQYVPLHARPSYPGGRDPQHVRCSCW